MRNETINALSRVLSELKVGDIGLSQALIEVEQAFTFYEDISPQSTKGIPVGEINLEEAEVLAKGTELNDPCVSFMEGWNECFKRHHGERMAPVEQVTFGYSVEDEKEHVGKVFKAFEALIDEGVIKKVDMGRGSYLFEIVIRRRK